MQARDGDVNPYLQQEVLTASPIRLRHMLICRAEELCPIVEQLWREGHIPEADGWLLRIRDILGELLDGVQDASNPASETISDFYVFLLQLLTQAELERDVERLSTLRELLAIEKETWRQVLQRSTARTTEDTQDVGLVGSSDTFSHTRSVASSAGSVAASPIYAPGASDYPDSGLNLEV